MNRNNNNSSKANDPALDPQVAEMMHLLLESPFPSRPFALCPENGSTNRDYADYLIHKDLDTENQCVFIFDSLVDAESVAEEYFDATGKHATVVECDIETLEEDRFWVRFYRRNGVRADLPLSVYKTYILPEEEGL